MPRDKVVDHETRRSVYSYIQAHPGTSFVSIQKLFNLTESTLRYHLSYLEKRKRISSRLRGNSRCYYPAQGGDPAGTASAGKDSGPLTDVQRRIIKIIRAKSGISTGEIVKRAGLDKRVVQYNVRVLRERMLVWKVGNGKNTRYEPITEESLQNELMKLLVLKFVRKEIDEDTYRALREQLREK